MALNRNGKAAKGLTAKQQLFAKEYLVDLNGKEAAIRAGYSPKTAHAIAYDLLRIPHVQEAVQAAMNERAKRTAITADATLEGIARIAKKAEDAEDWSAALKGHELIGKHLKLFTDKTELTGPNGGPVQFQAIERRIVDPANPNG